MQAGMWASKNKPGPHAPAFKEKPGPLRTLKENSIAFDIQMRAED